jgi:NAD-dependent deacetylase sirtuin 1
MMLRRFCSIRYKLPHHNTIDDAVDLLQTAKRIIVLTGAGISVSCGIPDFRSENGLYSIIGEKYPDFDDPQLMFDIHYFRHNPRPFFELAKEIFPSHYKPSATHRFIKLLEDRQCLLRNYTQNIDTLEKITGIKRVVHCHGKCDCYIELTRLGRDILQILDWDLTQDR